MVLNVDGRSAFIVFNDNLSISFLSKGPVTL